MVVLTTPDSVSRVAPSPAGGAWVYLGTDLFRRKMVQAGCSGTPPLRLGDRLHLLSEKLRLPFLDFVSRIGAIQTDPVAWWSTALSWKVVGASDLFLLVCYAHLADELCAEFATSGRPLLIVVEDRWLYRQLCGVVAGRSEVRVNGSVSVWPTYVRSLALGAIKRTAWALKLVRRYLAQRWHWPSGSEHPAPADVAIYSVPQYRSLHGDDGWADPYLGDVDRLLAAAGFRTCRFSPPDADRGFERALAHRSRYFFPLILEMTPESFGRALLAWWRPIWPPELRVAGLPVDQLVRREWWQDVSRASMFTNRLFLECMRRFLAHSPCVVVLYPYENQPWEKMIVLAARERRSKTVGYQHGGGMPRLMLSYFHGADEAEYEPLPDVIITSGPHSHRVLAEGGTPPARLVLGGSWRFGSLATAALRAAASAHEVSPTSVLVSLPITRTMVQHLLAAITEAFPDGGRADGLLFLIKPHPVCPVSRQEVRFDCEMVSGTFTDAIATCPVVVYTGSSVGMEALIAGCRALRYRSELLLNLDHSDLLDDGQLPTCSDHDLRMKLLDLIGTLKSPVSPEPYRVGLLGRVFAPIDPVAWRGVFERLVRQAKGCVEPQTTTSQLGAHGQPS